MNEMGFITRQHKTFDQAQKCDRRELMMGVTEGIRGRQTHLVTEQAQRSHTKI